MLVPPGVLGPTGRLGPPDRLGFHGELGSLGVLGPFCRLCDECLKNERYWQHPSGYPKLLIAKPLIFCLSISNFNVLLIDA